MKNSRLLALIVTSVLSFGYGSSVFSAFAHAAPVIAGADAKDHVTVVAPGDIVDTKDEQLVKETLESLKLIMRIQEKQIKPGCGERFLSVVGKGRPLLDKSITMTTGLAGLVGRLLKAGYKRATLKNLALLIVIAGTVSTGYITHSTCNKPVGDALVTFPGSLGSMDLRSIPMLSPTYPRAYPGGSPRLTTSSFNLCEKITPRVEAQRVKAERVKAERVKADKQLAAKITQGAKDAELAEAARQEAARHEAACLEEAARQEAARLEEAARQEAARQEAARQEAARLEAAKALPTTPVVSTTVVATTPVAAKSGSWKSWFLSLPVINQLW